MGKKILCTDEMLNWMVLSKLTHTYHIFAPRRRTNNGYIFTDHFILRGWLNKGLPGTRINLTLYIHSPRPRNFRFNRIKLFLGRHLTYGKREELCRGPFLNSSIYFIGKVGIFTNRNRSFHRTKLKRFSVLLFGGKAACIYTFSIFVSPQKWYIRRLRNIYK